MTNNDDGGALKASGVERRHPIEECPSLGNGPVDAMPRRGKSRPSCGALRRIRRGVAGYVHQRTDETKRG